MIKPSVQQYTLKTNQYFLCFSRIQLGLENADLKVVVLSSGLFFMYHLSTAMVLSKNTSQKPGNKIWQPLCPSQYASWKEPGI